MAGADDMRDRLRALRRAEDSAPDQALASRLADHVKTRGPALIRRSHQMRMLTRTAAVAIPLAIGAVWLGLRDGDVSRDAVASQPTRNPPTAQQPVALAVPAKPAPAACSERPADGAKLASGAGESRTLDLGERGLIVLEPGSQATFDAKDPCKLDLQLAAGRVSVHAKNLFGGQLKVSAGATDVVVHGTMFAVAREGDGLDVDVEEGTVGVERNGHLLAPPLRAGQQLQVRATRAPVLLALSAEARQQLRAAVAPVAIQARPSTASEPAATERVASAKPATRPAAPQPPSAAKLAGRADELWRDGAREQARARYHEAGSGKGPTAEAAWLALARRELSIGDEAAARDALASYASRFPNGELAAEAAGIEFRVALSAHDRPRAEAVANALIERYPSTPQAQAAARWRKDQAANR